jgi:hypothetical protein
MDQKHAFTSRKLLDENLITEEQYLAITSYRSSGFFSLRNELLALLYIAVLLIAAGAGILIYQNIDSIGHIAILTAIAAVDIGCIYLCVQKSKGYSNNYVEFESPVYDYLVLLSVLLTCTFIAYLQFQYNLFGPEVSLATLAASIAAFVFAYYFDNRSSLTIAITGLAAFIGIAITPQAVIDNNVYTTEAQTYYAIALGAVLYAFSEFSEKQNIKKHFRIIYVTFALHLIAISCIKGMFETSWPAILGAYLFSCFLFHKLSHQLNAIVLFTFNVVYTYIILNVLLFKLLDNIDISEFYVVLIYVLPIYVVGSIVLLIKGIKNFYKKTNDGNR